MRLAVSLTRLIEAHVTIFRLHYIPTMPTSFLQLNDGAMAKTGRAGSEEPYNSG